MSENLDSSRSRARRWLKVALVTGLVLEAVLGFQIWSLFETQRAERARRDLAAMVSLAVSPPDLSSEFRGPTLAAVQVSREGDQIVARRVAIGLERALVERRVTCVPIGKDVGDLFLLGGAESAVLLVKSPASWLTFSPGDQVESTGFTFAPEGARVSFGLTPVVN